MFRLKTNFLYLIHVLKNICSVNCMLKRYFSWPARFSKNSSAASTYVSLALLLLFVSLMWVLTFATCT